MSYKGLLQRLWPKTQRTQLSVAFIVIAALLIEATTIVQYHYARAGIRDEVQHRAETELQLKNLEIQKVMTAVEVAVSSMDWMVLQRLQQPDSIYMVTQNLVRDNQLIMGSAVAFVPYYFKSKGRQYSPYTYLTADKRLVSKQLGTDTYDYHHMEWYTAPMKTGKGHWSEPYYDEGGGEELMSTYSVPVRDNSGNMVAVFTADVSLRWLSELINSRHLYPSSFNLMVSRAGRIMACPVESLVMKRTIQEMSSNRHDTVSDYINQQMMAGQRGHGEIFDDRGDRRLVFYAPLEGSTGWSMAVVCKSDEIYKELRDISMYLSLLMLGGLLLMGYIVWRTIGSARWMKAVRNRQVAMESELSVASKIQMSLLPKTFPAFPERSDVDIYASLVPAKEVGGDLYDYFIRDEKLFFCIGDVSGKGVPASIVMSIARTLFRNASAHESKPSRIVASINETLCADNPDDMFVTFFVGVLDLPTGRLRYCNAGHDAPVIVGQGPLPCNSNLPLGTAPDFAFVQQETTLAPGTTLFLYTDGVSEAQNAAGQLFGKARVRSTVSGSTPRQVIDGMTQALHRFAGHAPQNDDITMLSLHYAPQQHSEQLTRTINLPNDVLTTPQLSVFVEEVCAELHLPDSDTMHISLAVEEAVVNAMSYAYPKGTTGVVQIDALANEQRLKFVITDEGLPFDPTERPGADTTLRVEDRPIGGLGIHLVRHYMDSINYERIDGRNVLTLRKKIKH